MYRSAPVLVREAEGNAPEVNPWGVRFSQGLFNMTSASHLFIDSRTFEECPDKAALMPLYEAKMVHPYDHRWATYELDGETSRDCTLEEKQNPNYQSRPRYWVPETEVTLRPARAPKAVLDACKKDDTEALRAELSCWLAGSYLSQGDTDSARELLGEDMQNNSCDMFDEELSESAQTALMMHKQHPLPAEEQDIVSTTLAAGGDIWPLAWKLLEERRPKYLLGWRDITTRLMNAQ